MICNRLLWISCSSNSLSDSQHGFLEGRTTETAAHSFVLCWNCFLFVVVHCLCVFYIKSAFNSAKHPAILAALIKRACSSYLIKVVKDFLLDINAKLSLNNEFIIKSWLAIKWGAFLEKIFPCMFFFFCFLLYCRLSWLPHVAAKRALHWWSIALELRVDVIKEE